jgi:hypothetical protein
MKGAVVGKAAGGGGGGRTDAAAAAENGGSSDLRSSVCIGAVVLAGT